MQFKKLSTPSLKELFVSELESKILSGELKVGEKLPSERELAEAMHVSRAVVNSGIAEMEQKGFLIVRPRVGTFVEDYRKNGTLDTLVSIMKYNGGNLAKDEIKAILELRIVLVNLAATLAIDNATDEQLNSLLPILNDISPEDSVDDLVEKTFRLHHELAFISGNVLLPLFFMSFKELVCKLWHRFITNYGKELLVKSNCNMINSVITRDKDNAVSQITNATMEAITGSKKIY